MNKLQIVVVVLFITPFCSVGSAAHHGGGGYDASRFLYVEGKVGSFNPVNPHSELVLVVGSSAGAVCRIWRLQMDSPLVLLKRGVSKNTLAQASYVKVRVVRPAYGKRGLCEGVGSIVKLI